jgi:redox-sensitive bicupin YhaK (pirin superfamily)
MRLSLRTQIFSSRALSLSASATIAALCGSGCGGSTAWTPPPASAIPALPGADETSAPDGSAAVAEVALDAPPAPPPGPSPISGDLPADIDIKLVANASCAQKECAVPGLYPPLTGINGKAPAAVWSHDIKTQGHALNFPKHSGVDLYGVTLKGSVNIKGAEAAKGGVDAGRWVAFRAPGAGVMVTANEADARVIFAVVGGGAAISDVVVELRGKDAKRLAWKTRPAPVQTADLAVAKDLAWAGGAMHARIGFEGESQRASLGLLIGSKDAPVAQHTHEGSWEILVALRAGGMMKRADAPGSTELAASGMTDGMVAAVPKGTLHAWEPGGAKPLIGLQLYVPPGPEQRFKALAAPVSAPAP